MNNIGPLETLSKIELQEIASLSDVEKSRYFIAGYVDFDYRQIVLFRGNGTSVVVSFEMFKPTKINPDFNKFKIIDYGQTIKLGEYEAAASTILIELDPECKKYYESIKVSVD